MPASASDEGNFARSAILDNRYAVRLSGRGRSPRETAKPLPLSNNSPNCLRSSSIVFKRPIQGFVGSGIIVMGMEEY